ncbi:hypothetical protein HK104_008059 [Borealophlyctis nickersoniae]|nr:hypothetical protein HK104_008059 [Borealophlyctis nickersoniae]
MKGTRTCRNLILVLGSLFVPIFLLFCIASFWRAPLPVAPTPPIIVSPDDLNGAAVPAAPTPPTIVSPDNLDRTLINKINNVTSPASPFTVALVNTYPAHDEVVASLAYTLVQIPDVSLSLYLSSPRFGFANLLHTFYPSSNRIYRPSAFNALQNVPDVVVLTTCGYADMKNVHKTLSRFLQSKPGMRVVCVVHNPAASGAKHMVQKYAGPLAREGAKVVLMTLSPHVGEYLKKVVSDRLKRDVESGGLELPVQWFVPTFVPGIEARCDGPTVGDREITGEHRADDHCFQRVAIQGLFEPGRRGYSSIFSALSAKMSSSNASSSNIWQNFRLLLLGSGARLKIPHELKPYVDIKNKLDYLPYYSTLHQNFALLPSFASDAYYTHKASSSVAAALITGVPLIGTERLLAAYAYLGSEALYIRGENETEVDAVERVLKLGKEVMKEKRKYMGSLSAEMIKRNMDVFRAIVLDT